MSETDNNSYSELKKVLKEAYNQAAYGKGKDRHAYGETEKFENQLICEIGRRLESPSGPCYQAVKKIYESQRLPHNQAIEELYGAINYLAAAIILIRETHEKVKSTLMTSPPSSEKKENTNLISVWRTSLNSKE